MRKSSPRWLCIVLLSIYVCGASICLVEGSGSISNVVVATRGHTDVLKIIETEGWDATSNSWKALNGEDRWSNELGHASPAPSDAQPPPDWEFDGDWKIVISGSDALGWEYTFQYLQAPKRARVWLRSLKAKPLSTEISSHRRPRGVLSRTLASLKDSYSFKGISLRIYKSLLSLEGCGLGVSIPLTMNFDLWDRNPGLPSISSTLGVFFPLTLTAALSASIHLAWLDWFLKSLLFFIPRLLLLLCYKFMLPAVWAAATAALLPLGLQMPPIPEAPLIDIAKPRYQSDISERVGCSLSYRWSKRRGIEWRFNYWHSYLPTFMVYRKLLGMGPGTAWWDKHFGSLGLSTGYPLPLPPHYSCALCLGLSGLYFKSNKPGTISKEEVDSETKVLVSTVLKEFTTNSTIPPEVPAPPHLEQHFQSELIKVKPAKLVVGSKAT